MKGNRGPVRVGAALGELHAELAGASPGAANAADAFLARHKRYAKGPGPGFPSHRLIRGQVRRLGPKVGFVPWWVAGRITQETILLWLKFGHRLDDPYEREIVRRLRAEYTRPDGSIDHRARWRLMPIASLAFVLWKLSLSSIQPGMIGFVQGHPRGMLARLSAAWNGGFEPFHPDTITRHLRTLLRILEGLLLRWQPDPQEAVDHDLPHSTQYLGDGRKLHQAINIYRWRDVPELRDPSRDAGVNGWPRALPGRAAGGDVYSRANPEKRIDVRAVGSTDRADPGSGYGQSKEIKTTASDPAVAAPEDRGARFGEPRRDSSTTPSPKATSSRPPIDDATAFEGMVSPMGERRLEMHTESLARAPLAAQPTRLDSMPQAEFARRMAELERGLANGAPLDTHALTDLLYQTTLRGGGAR